MLLFNYHLPKTLPGPIFGIFPDGVEYAYTAP